jgi:hypothetical protein
VVDHALAAAQPAVVDGLDAVAVRVAQERAVVVLAVLTPLARRAVVGEARVDAGLPEVVDLLARGRAERDVQPARDGVLVLGLGHQEVVPLREARRAVGLVDAERREHG